MKSYKHINLYPSRQFKNCYHLVLCEKSYIWIDLEEGVITGGTFNNNICCVLEKCIFNP